MKDEKVINELNQTELKIANSLNDLFEIELMRVHQIKHPRGSARLIMLGILSLGFDVVVQTNQDHER